MSSTSPRGSTSSGGIFDIPAKEQRLAALDAGMASPAFWEDNRRAQELIRERTELSRSVGRLKELVARAEDLTVLLELAAEADDGSLDAEIAAEVASLRRDLDEFELKVMMSGPHDAKAAILAIHPGAGGTESQDWAQMLLRMYLRWCERAAARRRSWICSPATRRGSSRRPSRSRLSMPTAFSGARRGYTGSCGSRRSMPHAVGRRASRRSRSSRWWATWRC